MDSSAESEKFCDKENFVVFAITELRCGLLVFAGENGKFSIRKKKKKIFERKILEGEINHVVEMEKSGTVQEPFLLFSGSVNAFVIFRVKNEGAEEILFKPGVEGRRAIYDAVEAYNGDILTGDEQGVNVYRKEEGGWFFLETKLLHFPVLQFFFLDAEKKKVVFGTPRGTNPTLYIYDIEKREEEKIDGQDSGVWNQEYAVLTSSSSLPTLIISCGDTLYAYDLSHKEKICEVFFKKIETRNNLPPLSSLHVHGLVCLAQNGDDVWCGGIGEEDKEEMSVLKLSFSDKFVIEEKKTVKKKGQIWAIKVLKNGEIIISDDNQYIRVL